VYVVVFAYLLHFACFQLADANWKQGRGEMPRPVRAGGVFWEG